MKETECLGLPYPECDPPLTKDASNIEQFRDLAIATDTAVQALSDSITANLLSPPLARMSNLTESGAGVDFFHIYTFNEFAQPASMADTVAGGIRIPEAGWYMVGGATTATFAPQTAINMRGEPLVNGSAVSSRQGPSYSSGPGSTEPLSWVDVLFLEAGDLVTFFTHHTGSPAQVIGYETYIWAYQVLAND